ncbi:MAG: helix-turn-helix transcriptional regulator [Clostridia bacterium]|nr:helix-turn-helix transcriptional regulator [Clostridia bacterium]MBP3560213.1 helix-turn-helix transcriptional regulator [Clostridia bacterium]
MNQKQIGRFIAQKRKEKNLTQMQLAEILGVSNKTVSKWENGNCMPDYSIIKPLCKELEITVSELMDGEEKDDIRENAEDMRIMFLLRRVYSLEKQNKTIYGFLVIVLGVTFLVISRLLGGSNFTDFFSGVFLGLSIGLMIMGIYVIGKNLKV